PSPWITAALEVSGTRALDYFARIDPVVRTWNDRYAIVVAERPWLNFSFFFRLMDRWGLPRTFVTEGVGGEPEGPLDGRASLGRMVRHAPRLVALQVKNLRTVLRSRTAVEGFASAVEAARDLRGLFDATVHGLDVALTTNFALNGALTGLERVRRALGIRGRAQVVTERMMREYDALRGLPRGEQAAAFERWLGAYGHRGPLESDPARPRFAELRGTLQSGLEHPAARPEGPSQGERRGPLFALDRRRESFRDDLMRVWARLRERILDLAAQEVEHGRLAAVEDVFLLSGHELNKLEPRGEDLPTRRARLADLSGVALPHTAHREVIEAAARSALDPPSTDPTRLTGHPLGSGRVAGRVVRADDLVALLERDAAADGQLLGPDRVLVAPALEPAWAVVFGRVGAVVTELGGELSHVAILLREGRVPALLNVAGACRQLEDGASITLDLDQGRVV
ncbi:MAG: PEP-utilizing enzyme, partial [Planctomycetota bacterium]